MACLPPSEGGFTLRPHLSASKHLILSNLTKEGRCQPSLAFLLAILSSLYLSSKRSCSILLLSMSSIFLRSSSILYIKIDLNYETVLLIIIGGVVLELNINGILMALFSYAIIGVFHPIVIKCQFYFTDKIWPIFLGLGLLLLVASVFVGDAASILLSITGAACIWSIRELKEQTERVEKGWFPKNPKHK